MVGYIDYEVNSMDPFPSALQCAVHITVVMTNTRIYTGSPLSEIEIVYEQ